MIFDLQNWQIALLNCLGIPAVHLSCAALFTWLPQILFTPQFKKPLLFGTTFFENVLLVKKWKHLLPDAAPWFNGFAKGTLTHTDPSYLKTFITETHRGEICHWAQFWLIIAIFPLWTPTPWQSILFVWACLSNLPCIINLRYTRIRLIKLLLKKTP